MTALAWCVSGLESGHGRDVDNGAGDLGWFQFTTGTYGVALDMLGASAAGWSRDPRTAPVEQQVAAFAAYEPGHPGAWPQTVPACT